MARGDAPAERCMSGAKPPRGFVLGKFMPPHQGHVFLCDFARHYVEQLTILVCSLNDDPIPGALRFAWMTELFPDCRVLWCTEDLPQEPKDDPENFWDIWRRVVQQHHPEPIDVVFASEDYGARLATEVGASFVPCDPQRLACPISGSAIRAHPYAHWKHLPAPVRPYFAKRACVFGPESSGKTTLCAALAARFDTIATPEYGRIYTAHFGVEVSAADLERIARGHRAGTFAALRQANRILIEDTDPLLTAIWSIMLTGARSPTLDALEDLADLYILCDIDFPWIDDGTRYFPAPADRQRFFDLCEAELQRRRVRYVRVSGSPETRLQTAADAIAALIA